MFNISKNLQPNKLYTFQTDAGRTLPLTVKEFLTSKGGKEKLVAVHNGSGVESKIIWSVVDGWDAQAFSDHVKELVAFIDATEQVGQEFIDSAIKDGLSVSDAVFAWFHGTDLSVEPQLHAEGLSGFMDIDIQGIKTVSRVIVQMNIQKDDVFNVYYGEGSKGGALWDTDLKITLTKYFRHHQEPIH